MASIKVTEPDGTEWKVKRRWLPWSIRVRDTTDLADPTNADSFNPLVIIGVFVIGVVLAIVVGLFLLIAEVIAGLLVALWILFWRFGLRKPWPIEASSQDGRKIRKRVSGWRDSGDEVQRLADQIRRGDANRELAAEQLAEA
jgi:hypothetical protein